MFKFSCHLEPRADDTLVRTHELGAKDGILGDRRACHAVGPSDRERLRSIGTRRRRRGARRPRMGSRRPTHRGAPSRDDALALWSGCHAGCHFARTCSEAAKSAGRSDRRKSVCFLPQKSKKQKQSSLHFLHFWSVGQTEKCLLSLTEKQKAKAELTTCKYN